MGSVFRRGDSWVIEYRERNGRIKRESLGKKGVVTKTQARLILNKREQEVMLKREGLSDAEIPTLEDFAREYIAYKKDTEKKPSWKIDEQHMRVHIIPYFGSNRILSDIKAQDIDDYKTLRLKEGAAPATVDRELASLRHLFNLADRWGRFFGKNPVSRAGLLHPNNQKERTLKPEEEGRLLSCANPNLRAIIICALNTGMRKSEILTLTWESIDLESNIITIDQTNTKSKKTRRIPINTTMRKLLLEQKLKSAGSDYVFLSSKGTPYKKEDSLKQGFSTALKHAGITGLRFHDLRHTAATRLVEAGIPLHAVAELLGHSSVRMTERYSHPQESVIKAAEILANFV